MTDSRLGAPEGALGAVVKDRTDVGSVKLTQLIDRIELIQLNMKETKD